MAMAKSDAQAQMIQSIAQGKQISSEVKKLADSQTANALDSGTQTVSGKTTQEKNLEADNPAKVNNTVVPPKITKPPYELSKENKIFIENALKNITPTKLANVKIILDNRLKA